MTKSVLLLSTGLGLGGSEKIIFNLAIALRQRKFQVYVRGLSSKDEMLSEFLDHGVNAAVYSMKKNLSSIRKTAIKLRDEINKHDIKILHAHLAHATLMASMLKIYNSCPIIIASFHSTNIGKPLIRRLIRASRFLRNKDILLYSHIHPKYAQKDVMVISNGVPIPKAFSKNFEQVYFLFLGRLEKEKNLIGLLEAVAACKVDVLLKIAGQGSMYEEIRDKIILLGIENRVELLGYVKDKEKLFKSCLALVLCSDYEGFPLAALEAGAHRTTVVSTPLTYTKLFSENEVYIEELANFPMRLSEIWRFPEAAQNKAEALFDRVQRDFDENLMIEKHVLLYNSILP